MEEKPIELPVSEQVRQPADQIQAPTLLDKLNPPAGGHKFKILGGFLGILVFAGAVFGAYKLGQKQIQPGPQLTPTPEAIATPTPDPTANWKTYTDPTKYNYSFKYPVQWEINPLPIGNGILISDQAGPNEDQISLEISSTKSEAMTASCKQIQQVLLDNNAASRCEFTQEISGERGIVYNPPIISKSVYIEALHNTLYYTVSLTFVQTSDKFKILDQILSTFKFLD